MSPKVAKPSPSSLQTEKDFQSAVVSLATVLGWRVMHVHDSRRQVRPGVFVGDALAAGFPDLVLAKKGRLIFAELKATKGRLTDKQKEWLTELDRVAEDAKNVEVYVWRPEQMEAIKDLLQARRAA